MYMYILSLSSCFRFCMALLMGLMLKDYAFGMIATVCSTWVFVSRSTCLGS